MSVGREPGSDGTPPADAARRPEFSTPTPRQLAGVLLAAAAIAVAARVSVELPGTPVPQSLQTLAVVLVGMWLGPWGGAASVGLYLLAGALGAPVFADGAGGAGHLAGPTAGYLAGFLVAAFQVGLLFTRPGFRNFFGALAAALLGHAVILGFGWLRLATLVGVPVAWETGVAPFVVGGLFKSVVAAGVWAVWNRRNRRRHGDGRHRGHGGHEGAEEAASG